MDSPIKALTDRIEQTRIKRIIVQPHPVTAGNK